MHDIPPFVSAQVVAAVGVGVVAGAQIDFGLALLTTGLMFGGTAISVVISSFIWPTQEAAGWKLFLLAMCCNPLVWFALLIAGVGWQCFPRGGDFFACLSPMVAALAIVVCMLPPSAGLLWRAWKRRGVVRGF
jgi:hypothetical protein